MNYQALTNDSLTVMYETVRGALAADDTSKSEGKVAAVSGPRNVSLEKARCRSGSRDAQTRNDL